MPENKSGDLKMAINEDIKARCDIAISTLHESAIPTITKNSLTQALLAAAKCTNGYPPEQKTQAMSESIFGLVELMSIHYVSDSELKNDFKGLLKQAVNTPVDPTNTKTGMILGCIKECKTQIMWMAIAVAALLAYQPQMASLVEAAINRNKPQIVQVQAPTQAKVQYPQIPTEAK